jgi:ArsR family metal-binding transcriptional regulator
MAIISKFDERAKHMLLTGYELEIFRSKCNPETKGVHCFAHLNDNVSEVLPFLNTVLGPCVFTGVPPALMFKNYGKLITIHSRMIAINALKDAEEAEKIVTWMQREINDTWKKRLEIQPSAESMKQPVLFEVFKLLPRSNCQECGLVTCMVFANRVVEGSRDHADCPTIDPKSREELKRYLSSFFFG